MLESENALARNSALENNSSSAIGLPRQRSFLLNDKPGRQKSARTCKEQIRVF